MFFIYLLLLGLCARWTHAAATPNSDLCSLFSEEAVSSFNNNQFQVVLCKSNRPLPHASSDFQNVKPNDTLVVAKVVGLVDVPFDQQSDNQWIATSRRFNNLEARTELVSQNRRRKCEKDSITLALHIERTDKSFPWFYFQQRFTNKQFPFRVRVTLDPSLVPSQATLGHTVSLSPLFARESTRKRRHHMIVTMPLQPHGLERWSDVLHRLQKGVAIQFEREDAKKTFRLGHTVFGRKFKNPYKHYQRRQQHTLDPEAMGLVTHYVASCRLGSIVRRSSSRRPGQ